MTAPRAIKLIDVTLRDAHQCLWATRMTTAMMRDIAPRLDRAGFEAIDLVGGAVFDVCVRYLREDPWERMRLLSSWVTQTPLIIHTRGQSLFTFEFFADDVVELAAERFAANGMRYHTPYDALNDMRNLEIPIKAGKRHGLYVAGGLVFTFSPVHTDAYYVRKAQELIKLGVDAVFLKDASGLLTPERVATLVPAIKKVLGNRPLQIHYALQFRSCALCRPAGRQARRRCRAHRDIDAGQWRLARTDRARRRAICAGAATTCPSISDPSGRWPSDSRTSPRRRASPSVRPTSTTSSTSSTNAQAAWYRTSPISSRPWASRGRLDEILEEAWHVREDLGYPIVVSPFAQYIVTQAVLNVVGRDKGRERYDTVPGRGAPLCPRRLW